MADPAWRKELLKLAVGEVLCDEPLRRYTSLGVGGPADALVFPRDKEGLRKTLAFLVKEGLPFMPLGKGTNLIVRDGGYRGVMIGFRDLNKLEREEDDTGVTISAEAGVPLAILVDWALKEGLTGLEFCAGVPGSVGGAVRMNAGAYGREIKDVVRRVAFLTPAGEIMQRGREELKFGYRSLAMMPDVLIFAAAFRLLKGAKEEIGQQVEKILALRKAKHPLAQRNAGSIFKNPQEGPAGQIIEEMGLKGVRIGEAQISEKHGNFIINLGRAKAADILALIDLVKDRVRRERGIILETEVCIIGEEA